VVHRHGNTKKSPAIKPLFVHKGIEPVHSSTDRATELPIAGSWETTPFSNASSETTKDGTVQSGNTLNLGDSQPFENNKESIVDSSASVTTIGSEMVVPEDRSSVPVVENNNAVTQDWSHRLEQLLINFFLIIFDSTADHSKLMMETFPPEATQQIENIFRLLLQADPGTNKMVWF